jgi:hypothetical protein
MSKIHSLVANFHRNENTNFTVYVVVRRCCDLRNQSALIFILFATQVLSRSLAQASSCKPHMRAITSTSHSFHKTHLESLRDVVNKTIYFSFDLTQNGQHIHLRNTLRGQSVLSNPQIPLDGVFWIHVSLLCSTPHRKSTPICFSIKKERPSSIFHSNCTSCLALCWS